MATTRIEVATNGAAHGLAVTVGRTPDGLHFTGDVDGHRFRFMTANLRTAEQEQAKARRALAAWTAIVESGLIRV